MLPATATDDEDVHGCVLFVKPDDATRTGNQIGMQKAE
jgi:hypothetical protein